MLWFYLSLAAAVLAALNEVISKKLAFRTSWEVILFGMFFFCALFSAILMCVIEIPKIHGAYYYSVLIASIIYVCAMAFFIRAITLGQLAKTVPLMSFTPIFLVVTSFLILKEMPSAKGLLGISAIIVGAYLLRIESAKEGVFEPFKLLIKEKGPRKMLFAAILLGFVSPFLKKAILNSSVFFALATSQILSTLLLGIYFFWKKKLRLIYKGMSDNLNWLLLGSVLFFLGWVALFVAINFGFVAYVISIKRTSILFTIIMGAIFFKEDDFLKSLIAGAIMVFGVFLIATG